MTVYYGFDTANYIYSSDVAKPAKEKWGQIFYARYLNPSPYAHLLTNSSGTTEFNVGWTYGVRYFMPITQPYQSRLNGTSAQGRSDASADALRPPQRLQGGGADVQVVDEPN